MTNITLTVTGAKARAVVNGPLTSGMVGVPVTIKYDDVWNGLTKNLVCRCGKWGPDRGETRTVLGIDTSATIAHEVMQADMHLYLGVEGYSPDGTLVIPTTWADCGKILPGANSDADPTTSPQIPAWVRILADVKKLTENVKKLNGQTGKNVDLSTLTLGVHTDGLVYIFLGGVPMGNGLNISSGGNGDGGAESVYGQPLTDNSLLKMVQKTTAILGIKLDAEPTQKQTITVLNDNGVLTFDKETLEFTAENWNEYQFVTVTAGSVEEDTTTSIILRNSDPLMTDKPIPVYVLAEGYAVDTTIPDGVHAVTADDFAAITPVLGNTAAFLGAYTGTYTNVYVPKMIDVEGTAMPVIVDNDTFSANTTIQYVTIEGGTYVSGGAKTETSWYGTFKGCTNLVGVKYEGNDITSLHECFSGCTSLKFFDGLEKQSNCTEMALAFNGCTALEYVQDLSQFTKVQSTAVNNLGFAQTFSGCSSLKRVFGLPSPESPCSWYMLFFGCAQLEQTIEVPENVNTINFAFTNDAKLRKVIIHNDNLTSTGINNQVFKGCTELSVYATKDSVTYTTLLDLYGASMDITIKDKSGLESPSIVAWGDSTTSPISGWIDWPTRLQAKVAEYGVKNQAVSGECTTSTSARQGGNTLKVGAFTIPADTAQVEITLTSADGQTFGTGGNPIFSAGASFNPCTIAGVKGTITGAGGKYYFARFDAGESVAVAADSVVTSNADDVLNNASAVMLVDLGTNSGWNQNPDTLLNQVQLMVDHFTAKGGTKYIICGASSGKHLVTENNRATWFEYEQKAAAAFGEHWLNMREYLIQNGLAENGLTASAMDTERMALGLIPASLLGGGDTENILMYDGVTVTDDTHPNAYGQNSKMNAFYNKGVALGYWS